MKFGLALTTQHFPDDDPREVLDGHLALVRTARDGGWDSVWKGEHYLQEGSAGLQQIPFLGRLSGEATGMTVGTGIQLLALHNPVRAAEEVATLDVLTGGRFVYGAGLGYRDVEFDAFRAPRTKAVGRFEANLAVMKQLWSGEPVHADLPWCRVDGVALTLRPIQRPHPPVWIAANSDAAVRRAARVGDAWLINPHATVDTVVRQRGLYLETREEEGRPPPRDMPMIREALCAPDSQRANKLAAEYLGHKYKSYIGWGQDQALPPEDRAFDAPYDDLVRGRFVVGSPAQCAEELHAIVDSVGVDHFIFRINWAGMSIDDSLRTIELMTEEVLPQFRRTAPEPPSTQEA